MKPFTSCTSIEQTLFKQIMTGDEILALVHLFLLKKLLCMCNLVGDWSRVLGSAQLVSYVLGSRASKGGTITTEQVQLGIGIRVQL